MEKIKKEKDVFKLSPLYDNELSCGADEPVQKMDECINDFVQARLTATLQNVFATVPESEMSYESKIKNKNNPTTSLVQFCMGLDEEIENFAKNCYEKLNMPRALISVEERIRVKLPRQYKDFLVGNYVERKNMLGKSIDEFYK